jgi:ATP-GRASP peptide maturase of grasp-with-spasm system
MILILSEVSDVMTDSVCQWLFYKNKKFVRINNEDFYQYKIQMLSDNNSFEILLTKNGHSYKISEFEKIWFRRGNFYFLKPEKPLYSNSKVQEKIKEHIDFEEQTLVNFLYSVLMQKTHINNPLHYNSNKLVSLNTAIKCGLIIPITLITDSKKTLASFHKTSNSIITKNIQDVILVRNIDGYSIGQSTKKISNSIKNDFWYSLFQEEIVKKYELRIFYFMGNFYTMAIFPRKETLDFRTVDVNSPECLRMVPYNLPKDIKIKIRKFMKEMELESGSIDMIVDPNDQFYFLEVNPVGQFHFLNRICNYYIEKEISNFLKANNEN